MKDHKVTLRIETTDPNVKTVIEHTDTFTAKNSKEAERMAKESVEKDLAFNCKITVLKTVEIKKNERKNRKPKSLYA